MTQLEFIQYAVNFIESDEDNMRNYTACFDYIEYHLMNVMHESAETTRMILQAIEEIFYGKHPELRIAEVRAMQKAFASVCIN